MFLLNYLTKWAGCQFVNPISAEAIFERGFIILTTKKSYIDRSVCDDVLFQYFCMVALLSFIREH
jgi:hypothetical protein